MSRHQHLAVRKNFEKSNWKIGLFLTFLVTSLAASSALTAYLSANCGGRKNSETAAAHTLSERVISSVSFDVLYLPEPPEDQVEFLIFTFYSHSHVEMHNLTINNKVEYARQHGYGVLASNVQQDMLSTVGGFAVCDHLNAIFVQFRSVSWLVVIGADHVIMNPAVSFKDIVIGESAGIIVSAEASVINLGMYFLRNSKMGLSFLNTMCAAEEMYKEHAWFDNQFAIEAWKSNGMMRKCMSMLPQRAFNSYPAGAYGAHYDVDAVLHCSTTYQAGDFVIHFPGLARDVKMRYIRDALRKVNSVNGIDPRTRC